MAPSCRPVRLTSWQTFWPTSWQTFWPTSWPTFWTTSWPIFRPPLGLFVSLLLICVWTPLLKASEDIPPDTYLVEQLTSAIPGDVEQLTEERLAELSLTADQIEQWAVEITWELPTLSPAEVLESLKPLLHAKQVIDQQRQEAWALRHALPKIDDEQARRSATRSYLELASRLIDLSGRLRYLLHDAIDQASFLLDPDPEDFSRLVRLVAQYRTQVAASTLAYGLLDPPPDSGAVPFDDKVKLQFLQLAQDSRDPETVLFLAEFLRQPGVSPELTLKGVEAIRSLGLPQKPRPGDQPPPVPPATSAAELLEILAGMSEESLDSDKRTRRAELTDWLTQCDQSGAPGTGYRWGEAELQAGDWLLMRNPSPYNRFTDLGTGLFTHVGVVVEETDDQGHRRWVIVEIPERQSRIPATNLDQYLQRTLHYVFLRHKDSDVAATMGRTAASVIGNECQFDLTFRTERVAELQGRPLHGVPIHTYCAGLLLICADATSRPRSEFFPIPERSAGRQFLQNLERLGMSIGGGFVSPTGPLFSTQMEIVAEREPMYDPGREVKEAIYDHFADGMRFRELRPTQDAYQQLRQRIVGLATTQPWLRRAVARAANVSEKTDLESAARAAAVVETLDDIADHAVRDFEQARMAILLGERVDAESQGLGPELTQTVLELRREHGKLLSEWLAGQLTPRELRTSLVDYYRRRGQDQLDERFFPDPE
jgi:hypothetical protein